MDKPENVRSPRQQLQGPRPAPLKVRKDSHKIRKPPVAPQQHAAAATNQHSQQQNQAHHQQSRAPPVIIYTVSPKVIHTEPSEFMKLVQRLTGPNYAATSAATTSAAATSSYHGGAIATSYFEDGGALSPAARFASIESTKSSPKARKALPMEMEMVDGGADNTGFLPPGILSPGPGSLPPIPPNFFSPMTSYDPNPFSTMFHDLSPVLHSSRNYLEGNTFMPSPSNLLSSQLTSPTSLDLFNTLFDF